VPPSLPFLTVSLFYLFWPLGVVFALDGRRSAYPIYLYVLRARPGPTYGPDPKGIPAS